jgi:hypothetical protein
MTLRFTPQDSEPRGPKHEDKTGEIPDDEFVALAEDAFRTVCGYDGPVNKSELSPRSIRTSKHTVNAILL